VNITADSPFKSAPRISRARFAQVVRERANPGVVAERDPGAYWQVCVDAGVDPLFILAMFNHESSMGKAGVAVTTHSWGNTRTPNFGATPIGSIPGRTGIFPVWRDWLDGCISTVARLVAPSWVYAERTAIREIFDHPSGKVWAPAGDLNSPAGYLRAMLDFMNQYADEEPTMTSDIPGVPWVPADSRHFTQGRTVDWPEKIIFHHTNGYDSLTWLTTSPQSNVSATYLLNRDGTPRAQLVRHRDTPHTTGTMNPMSLSAEWERKWPEQTEIPDSTYDNLAAFAVKVIEAERKRGNPVFAGEPRRAWFADHNDYYDTVCPGNLDVGLIFSRVVNLMRAPEPEVADDEVTLNGFRIYGGIFQAWKKAGGLSGPGLPITDEMDGASRDATRLQWFERGVAEWRPGQWPDNFDVTWGLVGQELYLRLTA